MLTIQPSRCQAQLMASAECCPHPAVVIGRCISQRRSSFIRKGMKSNVVRGISRVLKDCRSHQRALVNVYVVRRLKTGAEKARVGSMYNVVQLKSLRCQSTGRISEVRHRQSLVRRDILSLLCSMMRWFERFV
jgi:hypothetical protein